MVGVVGSSPIAPTNIFLMTKRNPDSTSPDEDVRVIKKYPNRRLYDTATSTYIALHDIKKLVMDRTPFVVRDVKTGDDLTRSILRSEERRVGKECCR